MNEYIKLNHMTKIKQENDVGYFIPHHGVIKEDTTTTKLRVVFDASAKTTSGYSFNDLQIVDPVIQPNLFDTLIRFRKYKYVVCADMEKMYRMCLVNEQQRNLQQIVWRENPNQPLDIYQLNTITYGTASAPFMAIRCLHQLGLDFSKS